MKQFSLFLLVVFLLGTIDVQTSKAQNKSDESPNRNAAKRSKSGVKSNVKFINPLQLSKAPGYTHVVEVKGGRTIYISGQIALDSTGNLIGRDDFRAQAEQVFRNLKVALDAVDGSFNDVIKLNIYVTDAKQLVTLREIRDKYVNTSAPPASTLVEVKRLAREELMIEIEAIAVLPE